MPDPGLFGKCLFPVLIVNIFNRMKTQFLYDIQNSLHSPPGKGIPLRFSMLKHNGFNEVQTGAVEDEISDMEKGLASLPGKFPRYWDGVSGAT